MNIADYITLASSIATILVIVLAALEKLPFVQKNAKLLAWVQEADAFAGQLRLILPPGSTLAQAEAAAKQKAIELAGKYPKVVTEAQATEQILGTLGGIVEDGHILPPSVQPAVTEFQTILTKLETLTASIQAQATVTPAAASDVPALPVAPAPAVA